MPIAALPPETVHVIGASQVLTDSASLVKELVDNALDARASAVFVEISSNALDIIQVKDNGYGIAPLDRNLICKREERISHPVGTTVRIVDFLKTIPVRRQSALKMFAKTLSKIKTTLQAYAMARPAVRFSLKVLKAKSEKGNFMYAPKPEASTTDAATKIVGKPITEQCEWKLWSSPNADFQVGDSEIYKLECLLPKARCDLSSVNNMGQYLSVDSRPVSCTRGVFKQIVSLFKSYLKSTSSDPSEKVVDPFLYLNLICPQGSYDVNIEPAKDDVLFTDTHLVLELLETCFRDVYGQAKAVERAAPLSKKAIAKSDQGFDLLLARKQSTPEPSPTQKDDNFETRVESAYSLSESPQLEDSSPVTVQGMSSSGVDPGVDNPSTTLHADHASAGNTHASAKVWKQNMYMDDSDVDDIYEGPVNPHETHGIRQDRYDQDEYSELHSAEVSNPWTIAKINAPLRQTPNHSANIHPLTPARQTGDVENAMTQLSDAAHSATRALPSPERTQNASSDAGKQSSSPENFPYPLTARRQRADNHTARPTSPFQLSERRGALDTWVQKSQADSQRSPPTNDAGVSNPNRSTTASPETQPHNEPLFTGSQTATAPRHDFTSARTLPTGTPLSEIPSLPQRGPRKAGPTTQRRPGAGLNKPFISPVNDPTKVWFETGCNPTSRTKSPPKRLSQTKNPDQSLFLTSEDSPPPPEPHPDLAATLDYETRKAAAVQQQRKALLKPSPHTTPNPSSSTHPPHGPRRKTAPLPLESIDPASTTLELILPLSIQPHNLNSARGGFDEYIAAGAISRGLLQQGNVREWEERLRCLLKARYPGDWEVQIELETMLQKHLLDRNDEAG
ncbi:MAG: hypothetical protein Q9195_009152 [Heterodermia aff. obscurata]